MKSRFERCLMTVVFSLSCIFSGVAHAGWDQLDTEALNEIIVNKTWKGANFEVYWKSDGQRKLIGGDKVFLESWEIRQEPEVGSMVCAGAGSEQGERCGIVEKKKNKYRSIRVSLNKGKKFKFKVKDGIPDF